MVNDLVLLVVSAVVDFSEKGFVALSSSPSCSQYS